MSMYYWIICREKTDSPQWLSYWISRSRALTCDTVQEGVFSNNTLKVLKKQKLFLQTLECVILLPNQNEKK